MVGSNVRMEHAASTPSLVLLEQLMDSAEDSNPLRSYPCSRKRSSLPVGATPPRNGQDEESFRRPQNLLQDLLLRSSSRRSRKGAAERKSPAERKGSPSELRPMSKRIWCDSEECLSSGPFIRIQSFNPSGQCMNCGRTMRDAATNTECSKEKVSSKENIDSPPRCRTSETCDEKHEEPSPSRTEDHSDTNEHVASPSRDKNNEEVDSENSRNSRKKSLPAVLEWWSDKVLRRQSSNLKDNVRKSWYGGEIIPEEMIRSPAAVRSISDQSLIDACAPIQGEETRRTESINHVDKEMKDVSKSTPNLSYPSTEVHKSHSARLAGWWEESPFPVRSQRFTFHSHSSGKRVVLRKGQSMFEVSAKGSRRHSTNFADLEELMGAASGSEEETETEDIGRSPPTILLPYQALEEEMDAYPGNMNQSNSTNSNSPRDHDIESGNLSRHGLAEFRGPHSLPKPTEILSLSTPQINISPSPSPMKEWSYMSPSLENVIQLQFLKNTSMASLQCQDNHSIVLPGKGIHTPKRLQSATRTGTKRRREPLRHSWAGLPNPLSNSVLTLAQRAGERSSWMGVIDDLPVIHEDRGKDRERDIEADFRPEVLSDAMVNHNKATSALGSQEPRLDPDDDDGYDHSETAVDPTKEQLLGKADATSSCHRPKSSRVKKTPFQRRVSPPATSFNPWVLQPQQLKQKLENLQQEDQGITCSSRSPWIQNGGSRLTRPELIVVDIFDDSQEVACREKMPLESAMEDPANDSMSTNNSNMDASADSLRDLGVDEAPRKNSRDSLPTFVRSVSNIISQEKEVFVDSPGNVAIPNERNGKHARTTNNNHRSLSPQTKDYVSKATRNGAIGNNTSSTANGDSEPQMNSYRQRKKSLALAMNEGRLEMKEVRMRPLDIETDFHLIAQLNQLNQELMDLSKSGSSPSSPGPNAKGDFSPLEQNHSDLSEGSMSSLAGPSATALSPVRGNVTDAKHSNGFNSNNVIPPRKEKSSTDLRHKKLFIDSPRRQQPEEVTSPVVPSKKSPELKSITETKDSKSVSSAREVLSRIKFRLSNSKFSRNSPQRSSAGKVEIQILRPDMGTRTPESEESPFRRSASLKHDSEARRTWPNMDPNTSETCNDPSVRNTIVGANPVIPRVHSDVPVVPTDIPMGDRQRKKPVLPEDHTPYLNTLEQPQNAPASSTDSGLGKDHRHSKSSADSLLEDFHISSPASSRGNSNPPSRPISSDLGDLNWEKGQEVIPGHPVRAPRRFLSVSMPPTPARLTPSQGSQEDLLDTPLSMPGSQEDLLGCRGSRMRASAGSQGSSISHAAMQSGVKPPKPRHRPTRRSKTDLGDPKIIKAALVLAKLQGDETPKVVKRARQASSRKRPTSALGVMGMVSSSSGRESPARRQSTPEGKSSPVEQPPLPSPDIVPVPLVIDVDASPEASSNLPVSPRQRSQSLGSLEVINIPQLGLLKRALSLPSGLGDDEEQMLSDPDLSRIDTRLSETFDQCCAATLAEALFDHVTMDRAELTFQAGDMIEITDMADPHWWWGCIDKQEGWLPAPFVRLKVSQGETVEECMSRLSQDNTMVTSQTGLKPSHEPLMRKVSLSFLSNDQVRANVIREIITTERDYVKNLADIYEGYIEQARSRPDMFNEVLMSKLFCNIEEIYTFQQQFLVDLETCIDDGLPHFSIIGACFLKYKASFDIYGEYCNNYPHAVSEFQDLMKDNKYVQFFEACRLLQSMIKISLDGFLLTPVQKICKYPLQLNELLKYTRPQHPDFQPLKDALAAMREVAQSINERKRRIEHIENIALWQKNIGDWEGDDVLDRSSMLIYTEEVNRVSLTGRHRTSPRHLFLFDHQLIICRKDILRRDVLLYKDRIDLDDCQIEDLPDGKENEWNVTLRYAWKIQNFEEPPKVYVFMCRSRKEKKRWLRHFGKERKIVHEGRTRGSSFIAAKEAAIQSSAGVTKPSKPSDRVVTVRRALSMPGRKVREQAGREGLQLPRATSTDVDADMPKKKGRSLFGFQVGKK